MKASRILAGLSAAAFVASLASMVSFADEAAAVNATDFGAQIYAMGSTSWSWASRQANFSETGELTATISAADLNPAGDAQIGDFGVQFFIGGEDNAIVSADTKVKATFDYKLTDKDGNEVKADKTEITFGGIDEKGNVVSTNSISILGYGSDWATLEAYGDLTLTATVSDYAFVEEEPAPTPEYKLPWTEANDKVPGDWGDDGYITSEVFKLIPEGKGATITMDYTLMDGYEYYLAGPCNANGWSKIYDEAAQQKYDEAVADGDDEMAENLKKLVWKASSIQGVDLKSGLTEEDLEARKEAKGAPVLQNDGYFIMYDSGSLTFNLSPEAVNDLANNVSDTNYGGLLFQVYGVDITSITVDAAADEPAPVEGWTAFNMWSGDWGNAGNMACVADGGHGTDAQITGDGTYEVDFGPVAYDETGTNVFYGDDVPEGAELFKWDGANQVWCVDILGLADQIGAGAAGMEDLTALDKRQMVQDAGVEIKNVKLLINDEEVYTMAEDTLSYGDIEGNGNLRIEIYNEWGSTTKEDSGVYDQGLIDLYYALKDVTKVGVQFDITGLDEPTPPAPQPPVEEDAYKLTAVTETDVTMVYRETKDFQVKLTDKDGKAVEGAAVTWVGVSDVKIENDIQAVGDVDPTVYETDAEGISTFTAIAGNIDENVVLTASFIDEDAKEYSVDFNIKVVKGNSSSDDGSSKPDSNNSGSNNNSNSTATEDTNPATGAAALGTVGVLLAGAAMAVSKKKH